MSYSHCSVPNCNSNRQDVKFHVFPYNNHIRLMKWLDSINSDILQALSPAEFRKRKRFVCHKHFEKRFITTKSRLSAKAYPTLFTNEEISSGIPTLHIDEEISSGIPTLHHENTESTTSCNINDWFPAKKDLIQLIKERPVIYVNMQDMTIKRKKQLKAIAWDEVAKGSMTYKACKPIWTKIRLRYAKLQIMINTGQISIQDVKANPKISRYLDGTLSFLDPHLKERTDEDIPFQVHKYIYDILDIEPYDETLKTNFITHAQVRALLEKREQEEDDSDSMNLMYLQNLVEKVISRKLDELLPNKLEPNKNNMNQDKNTFNKNNLGLESELILEDDVIKTDEGDEDNAMEDNLTVENNINDIFVDKNAINLEHISPNSQKNMTLVDDTIDNTLSATDIEDNSETMSTSSESEINNLDIGVSDNNLRKFFKELGEVMSMELSMEKQQILKLRINNLVKNIWEDL